MLRQNKRKILTIVLIILLSALIVYFLVNIYFSKKDSNFSDIGTKEESISDKIVIPENLIQCDVEIVAQNCDEAKEETVCGYDEITSETGEKSNNILQFKSACHYCKFYGLSETDLGGTKIKGLGYEVNPCEQGMYKTGN